jgi:hypothetical protein
MNIWARTVYEFLAPRLIADSLREHNKVKHNRYNVKMGVELSGGVRA